MVFSFVLPHITLIFLAPLGKEQFPFGFAPDISYNTSAVILPVGYYLRYSNKPLAGVEGFEPTMVSR